MPIDTLESTKPKQQSYLTSMPTDIINHYGLSKVLMTRRETIYLKHILKNVFVYGNEQSLLEKLEYMQFKSLFQYIEFITNKIRGIYKMPRNFEVKNADDIVKVKRDNFIRMLEIYKSTNPIVILDFDNTITNKNFHTLYNHIIKSGCKVIINSARPNKDVIQTYLIKNGLDIPSEICANKGKKRKVVNLKRIALQNTKKFIFYIDDETEYLDYGCLLGMYCYQYDKHGKIHNYTIFTK